MKKSLARMLMLSCVMVIAGAAGSVQAQTTTSAPYTAASSTSSGTTPSAVEAASATSAANASAAYTGMQPQMMMMMPAGMQPGVAPGLVPGQEEPKPVTFRYNQKQVEGFYGVELPKRLFNNVPSEWTHTPCFCERDNH